ncbi:hypothetical protein [Nitriliruptor alkaliphilus]|uniref:hypothetical protein n=1 Tax=Nitriliruptor alkaliphilus TaxID=427918 RepID=UPI0006973E86|nr:hypothetical protein [Nitriliruptor alkaliphilus]
MLLILVGLAFAVPILWTVSVGAVREVREVRASDPRLGCQAWVAVAGLPGRRYRCGASVYAGGPWCLRHEVDREDQQEVAADVTLIDEPQGVGRALVRARVGVPLAAVTALAAV